MNKDEDMQKLLHVRKSNWSEAGPGSWTQVICDICYDGSYVVRSEGRPLCGEQTGGEYSGHLSEAETEKLIAALDADPWRDPTIDNSASCDGVAWEMVYYSKDGAELKSSGKIGYIYGHRNLETIVSCLPKSLGSYSASGFIVSERIVPAYLAGGDKESADHRISVWSKKGKVPFGEFGREVTEGLDGIAVALSDLDPGICVGRSSIGNICAIMEMESHGILDVFPLALDLDSLNSLRSDVEASGLGEPDELHLDIVSIAIAVDYINYYDEFLNKQDISGRFALFKSSITSTTMGDIIIITLEGLGKLVVGYDAVKEILDKYYV